MPNPRGLDHVTFFGVPFFVWLVPIVLGFWLWFHWRMRADDDSGDDG